MFLGYRGQDIRGLMRRHRVTIAALAQRMTITQQRVREVRHCGLNDPQYARDWVQAITGCDPGTV
jgi:hypothetical protein